MFLEPVHIANVNVTQCKQIEWDYDCLTWNRIMHEKNAFSIQTHYWREKSWEKLHENKKRVKEEEKSSFVRFLFKNCN